MNRVYMYLLILLLVIPLPVAGYQYVMHRRAAFTGAPDYTADANCIAAYYFNGASGTNETDRSANGYNLTIGSASISLGTDVPPGYAGNSRDFESTDSDYFENTSLNIAGADQEISGACWIKFETTNATQCLYGQYDLTGDQRSWRTIYSATHNYGFYVSTNGTSPTVNHKETIHFDPATWYHLAFTYDDVQSIIYTNSVALSTNAHTDGFYDSTADFRVGSTDSGVDYFDGLLDELIVFDRALSPAEISDIYNNGIDGTKGGND